MQNDKGLVRPYAGRGLHITNGIFFERGDVMTSSGNTQMEQRGVEEFTEILAEKPTIEVLTDIVLKDTRWIPIMFNIIKNDKGTHKFICGKILLKISENHPLPLYPYFDQIDEMIDSSNNFIKWGAIVTLSNLVTVDEEHKFIPIYERYFDIIKSDAMITAANVAGNAWKIVKKYPQYERETTRRLLEATRQMYLNKGQPSPECQRILCGHVLDSFDKYFQLSSEKEKMIRFAEELTKCSRKAVATKAIAFLKKNNPG